MTRILLLSLVFGIAFTNALPQSSFLKKTPGVSEKLLGSYSKGSGFVNFTFTIKENGEYDFSWFSDGGILQHDSGTYLLKDSMLHFKIIKSDLNGYNMLDPKQATIADRKFFSYRGEDYKVEDLETEGYLQVIQWGERIYLVEPKEMNLFAAAVNFGFEPRQGRMSRNFLNDKSYLRSGDEEKIVNGKPTIPIEWAAYFPDEPFSATITKVETQGKERIYTVDKGASDGLRDGMALLGENVPADYDNLLWIDSTTEHSAQLKSYPLLHPRVYKENDRLLAKRITE